MHPYVLIFSLMTRHMHFTQIMTAIGRRYLEHSITVIYTGKEWMENRKKDKRKRKRMKGKKKGKRHKEREKQITERKNHCKS